MEQRLAAILAADVVGYSKLMGADQLSTLAALRKLRSELFTPSVARHGGETVKSMGDGWIVAFASVSDAVNCAIDIQNGVSAIPPIQLRMGVHLGDIVREDEDLFGDGVNIAARLEGAASPGDVLISDVVYHSLDGRLAEAFRERPPLKLKNIERPIVVFSRRDAPTAADAESGSLSADTASGEGETISLGFVDLELRAGDEEARILCEGVNEAIRTAIANQTGMSLLADPDEADMLVEGSMQALGTRYRAVIRLVDRNNQKLIKSERFEGVIADLFEAEDDLALRICTSLRFAAFRYEASSLDKSDLPMEEQNSSAIRVHTGGLLSDLSYPEWVEARSLMEIVLERDPDDASALAMAGMSCIIEPNCGWRSPTPEQREQAIIYLRKAVDLNPGSDFAQAMLVYALLELEENHTRALFAAEQLMKVSPHYAQGQMAHAAALMCSGEVEDGAALALKAIEPLKGFRLFSQNAVYLMLGLSLLQRYDEVLNWGRLVEQNIENVP
ncbi:MAG: adenylate/guanylate cyclase domain-containing protein, partial [Rhodospirillaceae bacterium]|nr:adenylate/guanylate cyclase domain-containing protein [Rhodospirillaceae bacterium]